MANYHYRIDGIDGTFQKLRDAIFALWLMTPEDWHAYWRQHGNEYPYINKLRNSDARLLGGYPIEPGSDYYCCTIGKYVPF